MLSNNYDKYLIDDKVFKFPNHFDNAWQQIVFLRTNKGILVSDNGLPSVIFESKPENHMAMQLQNAPIRLSAKMINYCLLDNSQSKDYNDTGKYFKKGDILEKQFKIYNR